VLLAAVGYAVGPMINKSKYADLDPRAAMGTSLAIAAVLLTVPALADPPARTPSADALWSLVILGLLCTAAAFVLYGRLVAEVGPGRATIITYVAPVVALALGVAVLDERPGPGSLVGLVLILAGSWLSTGSAGRRGRSGRRTRAALAEDTAPR
jgi:drug/metabolite transporter (DMT)-like permease